MLDPQRLLGQMLGGGLGDALGGRGNRRRGGGMLGGVGKAQLGIGLLGVAMAAWEHYRQQPGQTGSAANPSPAPMTAHAPVAAPAATRMPPPPPPPMLPAASAAAPAGNEYDARATQPVPALDARQMDAVRLIQAMIAAAAADGLIDDAERQGILGRAEESGLDGDTLAFLQRELQSPRTLQQVVADTRPELAAETYAAALLAITIDTEQERRWLAQLAEGLGLDATQRQRIHAGVGIEP
jgi:uncharacterized membrane protein YebE (DUF533 family)